MASAVLAGTGSVFLVLAFLPVGGGDSLPARRLGTFGLYCLSLGLGVLVASARRPGRRQDGDTPPGEGLGVAAAGLAAALVLLVYGWSLRLDFLADDWFMLALGSRPFVWDVWRPLPGWHHYEPIGLWLLAAPRWWSADAAWGFHLANLAALWLAAVLLGRLVRRLRAPASVAYWVTAGYVVYPWQYEAVVWISAVTFRWMAVFTLLSANLWLRYLARPSVGALAAATAAGLAAMLCIEQGVAVVPICVGLSYLILREREGIRLFSPRVWGPAVPLAAGAVGLLAVKMLWGARLGYGGSVWARLGAILSYAGSFLTPGHPFGLVAGQATATRPAAAVVGLIVAALVFGGLWRRSARVGRVGLWWFLCGGVPIFLGGSALASRYFALPAAGAVLWLVGAGPCATPGPGAAAWPGRLRGGLLLAVFAWSWGYIAAQRPDWEAASVAVRAVRAGIEREVPPTTPYDRVALVDLPWGVGEQEWPVLTLATGARLLVGQARGDFELTAIRAVRMWRTGPEGRVRSEAELVDADTVAEAAADPQQVVLQWDAESGRLVRRGATRLDAIGGGD